MHKEHKDGLYEKIFNEETKFEDMLCAFYVSHVIFENKSLSYSDSFQTTFYHLLALFKVAFTKYLKALKEKISPKAKVSSKINVNDYSTLHDYAVQTRIEKTYSVRLVEKNCT